MLGAMSSPWFDGFTAGFHEIDGLHLHARIGGRADAPALLMLHGFPQTHAMWHRVAQQLAPHFRIVLPDLRGYGDSDKPRGEAGHANYSKRAMAADVAALMRSLGHERYFVAGHDRGARVAHRLALDHAGAVRRLALLDIAPTLDMYEATDMRFASAYYHWFHLIQPHPLPERMIGADPRFYQRAKLGGWGSKGTRYMEDEALPHNERCFPPRGDPRRLRGLPRLGRHRPRARSRLARGRPAHRLRHAGAVGRARRGERAVRPAGAVAGAMQRGGQRPRDAGGPLHRRRASGRNSARTARLLRLSLA
jgi:pimeloyl-ACP methyl ester carboxylesterase